MQYYWFYPLFFQFMNAREKKQINNNFMHLK